MMTTPTEANVHAIAVSGTFDDCQALVKACSTTTLFATACRCRRQLDQLGAHRRAGRYYFVAGAALGAPHRACRSSCRPAISATSSPAMSPSAWACPIDQLVIASNANDILPRTLHDGTYEMREVVATTSPSMDIQISSNFERYLFEASGRDAPLDPRQDARAGARPAFRSRALGETMRSDFAAAAASEDEVAAAIRAHQARKRLPHGPAHRVRLRCRRRKLAASRRRRSCSRRRIRRSFPMPCRRSLASVRRCPRGSTGC